MKKILIEVDIPEHGWLCPDSLKATIGFLGAPGHASEINLPFRILPQQPAGVMDGWSRQTRKDIEQWMREAIADATQCEDADQDFAFADAIGNLLDLIKAPTSAPHQGEKQ